VRARVPVVDVQPTTLTPLEAGKRQPLPTFSQDIARTTIGGALFGSERLLVICCLLS
jgi:hypothetical protein